MRPILPIVLALSACRPLTTVDGPGIIKDTDGPTTSGTPSGSSDTATVGATFAVQIPEPPSGMSVGDDTVRIDGTVTSDKWKSGDYTATWSSSRDGDLGAMTIAADGTFAWNPVMLTAGHHELTLTVKARSGERHAVVVPFDVCEYQPTEHFDTGIPTGWQTFGDAYWDPGGWLEITGNEQSRAGSIYKIDRKVDPGDFRLEFRIATGGGINTGADGYAVNIVNVHDPAALATYIATAANGGCLGYGISPGCVPGTSLTVDALHIEFDTWYNAEFNDPFQSDHVEITFDGNPEVHPAGLSAAVPTLEDLQWRDVAVESHGTQLTATINGTVIIQRNVCRFTFDGGYIGVSGSTGWATNWHRFDDLRIMHRCEVPADP